MAVSFDLFGTLVAAERPERPADALAAELEARGVTPPPDWNDAYREPQLDVPKGREVSLVDHVVAALAGRGVECSGRIVEAAVRAAFDPRVTRREGAEAVVRAASVVGPVGVLSNCSVPGLVERAVDRAGLDAERFGAVVASVDCGFRKPDPRAFEAVADSLGVEASSLVHVGDDPATDGGVETVGGRAVRVGGRDGRTLTDVADWLEGRACP